MSGALPASGRCYTKVPAAVLLTFDTCLLITIFFGFTFLFLYLFFLF